MNGHNWRQSTSDEGEVKHIIFI